MIDLLCSKNPVDPEVLQELCFSTLLSPHDLRAVLKNHNTILGEIDSFQKRAGEAQTETDELKKTLEKELAKEQPNIKEITDRRVK